MHVLLTHEQADFDALGSLLGASLLMEGTLPILPRRINRNVKAFLTLYGVEFPFLEKEDVPAIPIRKVTIVDTQAINPPKGMKKDVEIFVIDHHPEKENLNSKWGKNIQNVGANTTLLIEGIQENNIWFSQFSATLMLLGIYEDTGKLSYARTTSRDIRAAAYLLDQGADLQIVNSFLNHPLSLAQQEIYEKLQNSGKQLSISGRNVFVGTIANVKTDDELSSIAHKLRDNFEVDVLILIAEIKAGIQLVLRATVDGVDLGELAKSFGGGGHARAAAALVVKMTLKEVEEKIIKELPKHLTSQIIIQQIMSTKPHLLSVDQSIAEADTLMKKYGFEGFPVVDGNKIVGLLTRKSVDRALGHKLKISISEVMSAGSYSVMPQHTIGDLQQVMMESEWGQIPVVENDVIVGIVTRTDLLKSLTKKGRSVGKINWKKRIHKALSPIQVGLLKLIAQFARDLTMPIYVVGGVVRDIRMGRQSIDYDLVVEGDAIQLVNSLTDQFGGSVVTHQRFGTAKWKIDEIKIKLADKLSDQLGTKIIPENLPDTIDFVTARREFYSHPTALPMVEQSSIRLDLHRRDFTINTLALRLDEPYFGDLLDFWGGLTDIRSGKIKVLHSLSFVDDPTRILRAVRFENKFNYQIESRTEELLISALPLLQKVSGDRIRRELISIFYSPNLAQSLSRLQKIGVLEAIYKYFPSQILEFEKVVWATLLPSDAIFEDKLIVKSKRDRTNLIFHVLMMGMKLNHIRQLSKRLRLSSKLEKSICDCAKLHLEQSSLLKLSDSKTFNKLEDISSVALYVNHHFSSLPQFQDVILKHLREWKQISPITTGEDLRKLNVSVGPKYAEILAKLKNAWIDKEISSEKQETAYLKKLIKNE